MPCPSPVFLIACCQGSPIGHELHVIFRTNVSLTIRLRPLPVQYYCREDPHSLVRERYSRGMVSYGTPVGDFLRASLLCFRRFGRSRGRDESCQEPVAGKIMS